MMTSYVSIRLAVTAILILPSSGATQLWYDANPFEMMTSTRGGVMNTDVGWTRIAVNDTGSTINYVTLSLKPAFKIGRLHTGLAIDLLVNAEHDPGGSKLRQSELKPGHIVRYVRYGEPVDPWFIHFGALDRVTLGHGFILSRYSNQMADQSRRAGVWLRVNRPGGGIETLVSNISAAEILGMRAFYRPFGNRPETLLLHNMEIGVSIVIDDDPGRGRTRFPVQSTEMVGVDIEAPVVKKSFFSLVPYGDFAKILDNGSGGAVGIRLEMPDIGKLFSLTTRIEQQFLGAGFIPELFDERYEVTSVVGTGQTRTAQLSGLPGARGVAGRLQAVFVNRLALQGAYRAYTDRDSSGVLHLEASMPGVIPRVTLRAFYDKQQIDGLSDIRTLDDRSVLLAEAMYRVTPYFLLGFDYRWTFYFDEDPNIRTYRPQERFMPKVQFERRF